MVLLIALHMDVFNIIFWRLLTFDYHFRILCNFHRIWCTQFKMSTNNTAISWDIDGLMQERHNNLCVSFFLALTHRYALLSWIISCGHWKHVQNLSKLKKLSEKNNYLVVITVPTYGLTPSVRVTELLNQFAPYHYFPNVFTIVKKLVTYRMSCSYLAGVAACVMHFVLFSLCIMCIMCCP